MFAKNRFLLPWERTALPFIKPPFNPCSWSPCRVWEVSFIHTHVASTPGLLKLQRKRVSQSESRAHGQHSQLTSSSPAGAGGAQGCRCAASASGRAGRPSRGDRRLTRKCEREQEWVAAGPAHGETRSSHQRWTMPVKPCMILNRITLIDSAC